MKQGVDVSIEAIDVSAYTVATDAPEADGTITWDRTTLVIVEGAAGGRRGLGFTYADLATTTAHLKLKISRASGR